MLALAVAVHRFWRGLRLLAWGLCGCGRLRCVPTCVCGSVGCRGPELWEGSPSACVRSGCLVAPTLGPLGVAVTLRMGYCGLVTDTDGVHTWRRCQGGAC